MPLPWARVAVLLFLVLDPSSVSLTTAQIPEINDQRPPSFLDAEAGTTPNVATSNGPNLPDDCHSGFIAACKPKKRTLLTKSKPYAWANGQDLSSVGAPGPILRAFNGIKNPSDPKTAHKKLAVQGGISDGKFMHCSHDSFVFTTSAIDDNVVKCDASEWNAVPKSLPMYGLTYHLGMCDTSASTESTAYPAYRYGNVRSHSRALEHCKAICSGMSNCESFGYEPYYNADADAVPTDKTQTDKCYFSQDASAFVDPLAGRTVSKSSRVPMTAVEVAAALAEGTIMVDRTDSRAACRKVTVPDIEYSVTCEYSAIEDTAGDAKAALMNQCNIKWFPLLEAGYPTSLDGCRRACQKINDLSMPAYGGDGTTKHLNPRTLHDNDPNHIQRCFGINWVGPDIAGHLNTNTEYNLVHVAAARKDVADAEAALEGVAEDDPTFAALTAVAAAARARLAAAGPQVLKPPLTDLAPDYATASFCGMVTNPYCPFANILAHNGNTAADDLKFDVINRKVGQPAAATAGTERGTQAEAVLESRACYHGYKYTSLTESTTEKPSLINVAGLQCLKMDKIVAGPGDTWLFHKSKQIRAASAISTDANSADSVKILAAGMNTEPDVCTTGTTNYQFGSWLFDGAFSADYKCDKTRPKSAYPDDSNALPHTTVQACHNRFRSTHTDLSGQIQAKKICVGDSDPDTADDTCAAAANCVETEDSTGTGSMCKEKFVSDTNPRTGDVYTDHRVAEYGKFRPHVSGWWKATTDGHGETSADGQTGPQVSTYLSAHGGLYRTTTPNLVDADTGCDEGANGGNGQWTHEEDNFWIGSYSDAMIECNMRPQCHYLVSAWNNQLQDGAKSIKDATKLMDGVGQMWYVCRATDTTDLPDPVPDPPPAPSVWTQAAYTTSNAASYDWKIMKREPYKWECPKRADHLKTLTVEGSHLTSTYATRPGDGKFWMGALVMPSTNQATRLTSDDLSLCKGQSHDSCGSNYFIATESTMTHGTSFSVEVVCGDNSIANPEAYALTCGKLGQDYRTAGCRPCNPNMELSFQHGGTALFCVACPAGTATKATGGKCLPVWKVDDLWLDFTITYMILHILPNTLYVWYDYLTVAIKALMGAKLNKDDNLMKFMGANAVIILLKSIWQVVIAGLVWALFVPCSGSMTSGDTGASGATQCIAQYRKWLANSIDGPNSVGMLVTIWVLMLFVGIFYNRYLDWIAAPTIKTSDKGLAWERINFPDKESMSKTRPAKVASYTSLPEVKELMLNRAIEDAKNNKAARQAPQRDQKKPLEPANVPLHQLISKYFYREGTDEQKKEEKQEETK